MGEHQLALHLDDETMDLLQAEARWQDRSESELAADAIRLHLERQAHERQAIEAAIAEADKGIFISEEVMMAWLERLETDPDAEAPEPDVFLSPTR